MNDRHDAITMALRTAVDIHAMLEENPSATEVDAAGKALLRAGIALLFQDQGPVVVMPLDLNREVYCTLSNASGALNLVLDNITDIDRNGGVSAVVDMTRTALAAQADRIDDVVLRRAGWVFAEDA